jgi:hypothetical protein
MCHGVMIIMMAARLDPKSKRDRDDRARESDPFCLL